MTNLEACEQALTALSDADRASWRSTLVRTLAASMDEEPRAATANQYRVAMNELLRGAESVEEDVFDEFTARLNDRRSAS